MTKSSYEYEFDVCPFILKNFFHYIRTIRGKEANTVRSYYYSLKQFFLYILHYKGYIQEESSDYKTLALIDEELIKSVTSEDILSYLYYSSSVHKTANSTRGNHLSAIKQYFEYLYFHAKLIEVDPAVQIGSPKKPKKLPKYLTLEQALDLLKAVDGDFKERDMCILVLFLNCGIRISELVGLNYKDIRPDNTILIHGKGNKERILYLNKACIQAIEEYKAVRPVDGLKDKDAFFVSRLLNRISTNTVRHMVESNMEKIGLGGQGYSPHKLRHTAATLMHSNGVDIRTLQEVLGHNNLATTQIYTHIANEQVKSALESNPLANENQ
ncbi:MAG: tyrosine-type recombinase/integrase [Ruminococcus sp.]|nr:tyrosine-type recombinase/integrase [Ruminococcus sp.]